MLFLFKFPLDFLAGSPSFSSFSSSNPLVYFYSSSLSDFFFIICGVGKACFLSLDPFKDDLAGFFVSFSANERFLRCIAP